MLLQKENDFFGQVIAIKLISGEEILAKCISAHPLIQVKYPLSLVLGAQKDSEIARVAFTPWMLSISSDQTITLSQSHILFISKAGKDATNQYNKAISNNTNIQ